MAVQNPGVEMIASDVALSGFGEPLLADVYAQGVWSAGDGGKRGGPVVWEAGWRRLAREAGIVRPFPGRVSVSYVLYPKCPADWKRGVPAPDPARWERYGCSVSISG